MLLFQHVYFFIYNISLSPFLSNLTFSVFNSSLGCLLYWNMDSYSSLQPTFQTHSRLPLAHDFTYLMY